MPKENGGPAFPSQEKDCYGSIFYYPGMTLRDYFAGQVLAGRLSNPYICQNMDDSRRLDKYLSSLEKDHSYWAYRIADAMMEAREL